MMIVFSFFCLLDTAQAAEVSSTGRGEVKFVAHDGEANRVRVTATDHGHLVVDKGAPLSARGTCTSLDEHSARCDYDPPCAGCGRGGVVLLNDGRDHARFGPGTGARVYGGSGGDRIVSEEPGLDVFAGPGDDVVLGGSGRDTLDGGLGADVLDGRGGDDTATYYRRSRRVTVTLDGRANDGERGEGDLVKTEFVYGGSASDRLMGNDCGAALQGNAGDDELVGGAVRDALIGNDGDDTLYGGGGDDTLTGEEGDDAVHGGAGSDEVYGFAGADALWGGAGDDRMYGHAGADEFRGGPGDDRILSSDENPDPPDAVPDRIRCGAGEDTVLMGPEDHAGHGCETVVKGAPPR
jgi:Ca2+-binding RTX toxin-like protein